jgi:hypothetical protein
MNAQPLASQPVSSPPSLALVVVAVDGRFGYCDACAAETVFERPWCTDGHGDLCAEWVCTDCGNAVIVEIGDYLEPLPVEPVTSITRARRIAAA